MPDVAAPVMMKLSAAPSRARRPQAPRLMPTKLISRHSSAFH
jgi:hypothetical protein